MAIDPTGADMKAFLAAAPDEPVTMLNLLRFVEGGRARYDEYIAHFRRTSERFGAQVVYYGYGGAPVVAEQGQDWDAVLLVHYPSRRAFSDMVRDPEYQQGTHLRTEALVEAVLQPTTPRPDRPRPRDGTGGARSGPPQAPDEPGQPADGHDAAEQQRAHRQQHDARGQHDRGPERVHDGSHGSSMPGAGARPPAPGSEPRSGVARRTP